MVVNVSHLNREYVHKNQHIVDWQVDCTVQAISWILHARVKLKPFGHDGHAQWLESHSFHCVHQADLEKRCSIWTPVLKKCVLRSIKTYKMCNVLFNYLEKLYVASPVLLESGHKTHK